MTPPPTQKIKRDLSFLKIVSSALAIIIMATPATAVTINLLDFDVTKNDSSVIAESIMSDYHAGVINQALFRRVAESDDDSAGSGNFRDLYRLQANPTAQGYNREVDGMDSSTPNGFNSDIRIFDLLTDNSGLFHVFAIDVNESGNASNRFISMDKFQLYVGGSTDSTPLPTTEGSFEGLNGLGTKVYDMDDNEDSTILMDASLSSGSGKVDMFVFVSVALFKDLPKNSLVYLYTEFGSYTEASLTIDFSASSGHEDIAVHATNPDLVIDSGPTPFPEPSTGMLGALGLLMMLRRRNR